LQDDQLEIIPNGGILTKNGVIAAIGSFQDLRKEVDLIEEVTYSAVAMPGLIDCHTHMVWGGSRAGDYALRMRGESYEKILESGGGILDSVRKTREASKETLLDLFISRVKRQQASGITTIEVKSGYGLDKESEIKMLEVVQAAREKVKADLIATCLAAHVCPKEFTDKSAYLDFVLADLLPELKEKNLATRVDAFVEPSAFPVDIARPYLQKAKAMGFDLTIHADQFTIGGSALAVELGARSADHLEASGEKEIALLAKSDVVAVALPGASLGLGMQFTPASKLLNAGASVAISTDWNPGSAPMGDLLTQAALLGIYEKLSTAEVLAAITFRAAVALGLRDRGILAPDMRADFIAFPTHDFRDILYQQGMMRPTQVWKVGRMVD
jgi:imidazolonepropionase